MNPYHKHTVTQAIEALARRYGNDWSQKWAKVSPEQLLADWCMELQPFTNRPEAITWALQHLPERCPNVIQFRHLCMSAPRPEQAPRQEAPTRGPTAEEREHLLVLRDRITSGHLFARPGTGWAFAIVARHEAGQKVSHAALRMALEVVEQQRRYATQPAHYEEPQEEHHASL